MTRAGDAKRSGVPPRTILWIAALIVVALWAQPWAPRKGAKPAAGPETAVAPAAAVAALQGLQAAPYPAPPTSTAPVAGPGWGRDPFDPRPTASGGERTGR